MRTANALDRPLGRQEIVLGERNIGERIAVEDTDECIQGFIQYPGQLAARGDHAPITSRKTLDESKVRLRRTHKST